MAQRVATAKVPAQSRPSLWVPEAAAAKDHQQLEVVVADSHLRMPLRGQRCLLPVNLLLLIRPPIPVYAFSASDEHVSVMAAEVVVVGWPDNFCAL